MARHTKNWLIDGANLDPSWDASIQTRRHITNTGDEPWTKITNFILWGPSSRSAKQFFRNQVCRTSNETQNSTYHEWACLVWKLLRDSVPKDFAPQYKLATRKLQKQNKWDIAFSWLAIYQGSRIEGSKGRWKNTPAPALDWAHVF